MAVTTVEDIIEELNYEYDELGFEDHQSYEDFVEKRLEWVATRVENMISSANYVDTDQDVVMGELFWACDVIMARAERDADEGFMIGDFTLFPPRIAKRYTSERYFSRAMGLLNKYCSIPPGAGRIKVLENTEDTEITIEDMPDVLYFRGV